MYNMKGKSVKSIMSMLSLDKVTKKIKFLSKPNNMKKVLILLGFLLVLFAIYKYYLKEGFESTPEDLEDKIAGQKSAVLFHADWCGHCKKFIPQWDKLSSTWEEQGNDVKLFKVECGKPSEKKEHSEIMEKYNIKGYPTIMIFNNGSATEYTGNRDISAISEHLKQL